MDPTKHGLLDEDLVSTGRQRVYGIPQSSIDMGLSFPYISFASLPFYHDRRQLGKVSCLQMTETKLFFVWDSMYHPENIEFFRDRGQIERPAVPERSNIAVFNDANVGFQGFTVATHGDPTPAPGAATAQVDPEAVALEETQALLAHMDGGLLPQAHDAPPAQGDGAGAGDGLDADGGGGVLNGPDIHAGGLHHVIELGAVSSTRGNNRKSCRSLSAYLILMGLQSTKYLLDPLFSVSILVQCETGVDIGFFLSYDVMCHVYE